MKERRLTGSTILISSATMMLLLGSSIVPVSAAVNSYSLNQDRLQTRAGLADLTILQNENLKSDTGNDLTQNSDGTFDLSLTFSGTGLASVGLGEDKALVYSLPPELQGKVNPGAQVTVNAQLLPIVPADIPGINLTFGTVITAADTLIKAADLLPGVDLSELETALHELRELKQLGAYTETLPAVVSPDGKSISVDFTDGLGKYVNQAYSALFTPLRDIIDGLHFDGLLASLNVPLDALRGVTTPLFDLLDEIAAGTSNILSENINANILGQTSGTLTMNVSDPQVDQATVKAAAINDAAIDASILSIVDSEGTAVTLNFNTGAEIEDPLADYIVSAPSITPIDVKMTEIKGTVTLAEPIPAGTSFEALITLPDGTIETVPINTDGSFTLPITPLTKDQVISVQVKATNGIFTKNSVSTEVTVTDEVVTDPLAGYQVNAPTVTPVKAEDTNIKGSVVLATPIPTGTTFKAILTLPDGSQVSADVADDWTFTLPVTDLSAGEELSVLVQAVNGNFNKESTATPITVLPKDISNPLENYPLPAPSVDPLTNQSPFITGVVELAQPMPVGTSFEALIILPDGTLTTTTVDPVTGRYSLSTLPLVAGANVSVQVKATNGLFTKLSTPTTVTVSAVEENPLADYVMHAPEVDPINDTTAAITGQVTLEIPIPVGTGFKAVVTLPDGTVKETSVDDEGQFNLAIDPLTVEDEVSVKIVAENGTYTKESDPTKATVERTPVTDPLADYQVGQPTVNTVTNDQTKVTGHVTLTQPIPGGTRFNALVTMPDGQIKSAVVEADGSFTVDVGDLTVGTQLSVVVQAVNGTFTKDSLPTIVQVDAAAVENPLANYQVNTPVVPPLTTTNLVIGGSVTLNQPIPAGTTFVALITRGDGTTMTTPVETNGDFSAAVVGLLPGETITVVVQATNGLFTKNSLTTQVLVTEATTTNPLENYPMAQPTINEVLDGDTEVTGQVTLSQPIPADTTFEAKGTLPDGSEVTVGLNPDGSFALPTGPLAEGDEVTIVIEASNNGFTKESTPVTVTVEENDETETDPLANYPMNLPTVNKVVEGDTEVTGQVALSQPIPENTSFEVKVTLPDGSEVTAALNPDGSFVVPTGPLTGGDMLTVVIEASNNGFSKESTPVTVEVIATEGENPLADYPVGTPTLNPLSTSSTAVAGSVVLAQPVPTGTTFTAVITRGNGTVQTVAVNGNGQFQQSVTNLVAGERIQVAIKATNGNFSKLGIAASVVVRDVVVTNPIEDYIVVTPVLDPMTTADVQLTGSVQLTQPVPTGTTFTAIGTLANGQQVIGMIDGSGNFSLATGQQPAGSLISVYIQATNSGFTKYSPTVTLTVTEAAITNPIADYQMLAPTINPIKVGDTKITGTMHINTPVPAGTTFKVFMTDGTGKVHSVDVAVNDVQRMSRMVMLSAFDPRAVSNYDFEVTIDPVKAGDQLTAYTQAINGAYSKNSELTNSMVPAVTPNPDPEGNGNGGNEGSGTGTGNENNGNNSGNGTSTGNGNQSGTGNSNQGLNNQDYLSGSHNSGSDHLRKADTSGMGHFPQLNSKSSFTATVLGLFLVLVSGVTLAWRKFFRRSV